MKKLSEVIEIGLQWAKAHTDEQPHWMGLCVVIEICASDVKSISMDEANQFFSWIGNALKADGSKCAYLINHLCNSKDKAQLTQAQLYRIWRDWYQVRVDQLKAEGN